MPEKGRILRVPFLFEQDDGFVPEKRKMKGEFLAKLSLATCPVFLYLISCERE